MAEQVTGPFPLLARRVDVGKMLEAESYALAADASKEAAAASAGFAAADRSAASAAAADAISAAASAEESAGRIDLGALDHAVDAASASAALAGGAATTATQAAEAASAAAGSAGGSADTAAAWAEGGEPGGPHTKSAKGWAHAAEESASRVDLGALDAALVATGADRAQTGLDRAATAADRTLVATDRAAAQTARAGAETARDAAFVNAAVYTTIAAGLAASTDGQQFQVAGETGIIRYRRDSAAVATEVARYPTAAAADALAGSVGALSAVLGQAVRDLQALASLQAGDAITAAAVAQLLSLLGQVSGQINGGRAALAGGTLADPALRIGTVGIYSAAANTLSVSISGVERLRVSAAGITVYGTVTTA